MAILTPMQGFFRYLVYMRPRWIAYRKWHPELGRCIAVAKIFCGQFGKGNENEDSTDMRRNGSGRFSTSAQAAGASVFSRITSSAIRETGMVSVSSMKRSSFVSPSPVSEEERKEDEHPHDGEDSMIEIMPDDGNDEEIPEAEGADTDDCKHVISM